MFLPFARRIAADAHDAVVALADADDNERRILDIGSIPVMVPYGITELLHGFEGRHRNTRLHITEGEVDILRQMLRKRQIDLAFIRERDGDAVLAGDDADFATTLIAEDRLAAVLPVGHPLAKRSGSARARGRRLSPTFVDLAPSLPMRLVTVRAATPPRAAASLRDGIAPFACQHSGDSSLEPCAPTRALSCYTRGM